MHVPAATPHDTLITPTMVRRDPLHGRGIRADTRAVLGRALGASGVFRDALSTTTPQAAEALLGAIAAIDATASCLVDGDVDEAVAKLNLESRRLGWALQNAGLTQLDMIVLNAVRANLDNRAAAYTAAVPKEAKACARELEQTSDEATRSANRCRDAGAIGQAQQLEAIAADSRYHAFLLEASASNQDALVGAAIARAFFAIVDAVFARQIDAIGRLNNLVFGTRDELKVARAKMSTVFDALDRLMVEHGISFHEAWSRMHEDRRMGVWSKAFPFSTRRKAMLFMREHRLTRPLLVAFVNISRGFQNGDGRLVESARSQITRTLEDSGHWIVASTALRKCAAARAQPPRKDEYDRVDESIRGDYWKRKATEFAQDEMTGLVALGLGSGDLGTLARSGALPSDRGGRVHRSAELAAQLGGLEALERVLDDVLATQPTEKVTVAMPHDRILSLQGSALFRVVGGAWRRFRAGSGRRLTSASMHARLPDDGAAEAETVQVQAYREDKARPRRRRPKPLRSRCGATRAISRG